MRVSLIIRRERRVSPWTRLRWLMLAGLVVGLCFAFCALVWINGGPQPLREISVELPSTKVGG